MTIAFIFQSDKIGQNDYDELMKGIDRESTDAPLPDGFIAHFAGPKPGGGWQVIDIWDSEDNANSFYGSEQFSAVSSKGEEIELRITQWPLHRAEIEQTLKEIS